MCCEFKGAYSFFKGGGTFIKLLNFNSKCCKDTKILSIILFCLFCMWNVALSYSQINLLLNPCAKNSLKLGVSNCGPPKTKKKLAIFAFASSRCHRNIKRHRTLGVTLSLNDQLLTSFEINTGKF